MSPTPLPASDAVHRLLFRALLEIRAQGDEHRDKVVFHLADIFHNVVLEMEKAGLSFARFLRALRMGLGNRHKDPKVAAGLALFRRKFRASSMVELLEIARRLREIFGAETGILQAFAQDELLRSAEGDLLCHGEGLSDEELQSEIRRVLNPGPRREQAGRVGSTSTRRSTSTPSPRSCRRDGGRPC